MRALHSTANIVIMMMISTLYLMIDHLGIAICMGTS
jgi:hypothetical protein